MNYQEAVALIHSRLKFGVQPGLERMEALMEALGHPEKELLYIHVAGTNGKGSTCTMLSHILQQAGYKTGLFTSPYVVDFCERIQVNGQMIPHADLAKETGRIVPILEQLAEQGIEPTEFEVVTALAFSYFARVQCEVVVLEVGLGGRLDSTNIIPAPLVSVLTAIAYDHMAVLGHTLTEIASEKAGIIKEGGVTVAYPCQRPETWDVVRKMAADHRNVLLLPDTAQVQITQSSLSRTEFIYQGEQYVLPLLGQHQVYNAVTVIEAARAAANRGLHLTPEHIFAGIAQTRIPARMELLSSCPLILIDGGHNEACSTALEQVLRQHLPGKRLVALMGMMEDKAYDAYLKNVGPCFSSVFCVQPENPRALSAQALAQAAGRYCSEVAACPNMPGAVHSALEALQQADGLIVCGSFYLAAEARPFLKKYL